MHLLAVLLVTGKADFTELSHNLTRFRAIATETAVTSMVAAMDDSVRSALGEYLEGLLDTSGSPEPDDMAE